MDDIFYPLHSFKEQFTFEPTIINQDKLIQKKNIIICGMGGSAISISLINLLYPELPVTLHNGYGLPKITDIENTHIILNSYSGNTEEILDVMHEAKKVSAHMSAVSCGGELINQAVELGIPHITLPLVGVEPRFAIGHQILALLSLLGEKEKIEALKKSVSLCDLVTAENSGKQLSSNLFGKYPIFYVSKNLFPIAYLIKAAITEGSKTPCFINTIPEACHNEIQGFVSNETHKDAQNFIFTMFTSSIDHPRTLKRFNVLSELYSEQGYSVVRLESDHTNHTRVFELILTGYFAATYLAIARNVDTYKTPFIQDFKKRML